VFCVQYWIDYQLKWLDDDDKYKLYQDIQVLRVSSEYVWRPDVVLFNK